VSNPADKCSNAAKPLLQKHKAYECEWDDKVPKQCCSMLGTDELCHHKKLMKTSDELDFKCYNVASLGIVILLQSPNSDEKSCPDIWL